MEGEGGQPKIRITPRATTETPRVRLSGRETNFTDSLGGGLGQLLWNKLSPEKQAALEGPIRKIEQSIAKQFPEGYASPLVGRLATISREQLERQTDATSCTYVATANALRVVDKPRIEYSRDALKSRIEQLTEQTQANLSAERIDRIFNSGTPYSQFALQRFEQPKIRMPQVHPEMMEFFRALQGGDIAVADWRLTTEAIRGRGGFIDHARTIIGFSRGPNESILLHVIDPYGARQETWSFRDWVVASRMNSTFDNPLYDVEDVRKVAEVMGQRSGIMAGIASDIWVIHKKSPKIVISKAR